MQTQIRKKAASKLATALETYFADKIASVPPALAAVLERCSWARDFMARHAVTLHESASAPSSPGSLEPVEKDKEEEN